jgi:tRNA threonylcarbamoyladenosine biosynthesis protein TsaE
VISLPTAADTRALGIRIGEMARAGDLIVLAGPLGAGKTVLVQGIGAGLGIAGHINSPTFVISRIHKDGRLPLVHVDAYRLGDAAEVDDLDLDTDLSASVTAIEWGAGLVEQLTDERLVIEIDRAAGSDIRTAQLLAYGDAWAERLPELRETLSART